MIGNFYFIRLDRVSTSLNLGQFLPYFILHMNLQVNIKSIALHYLIFPSIYGTIICIMFRRIWTKSLSLIITILSDVCLIKSLSILYFKMSAFLIISLIAFHMIYERSHTINFILIFSNTGHSRK